MQVLQYFELLGIAESRNTIMSRAFDTALTRALGIKVPIIQGGMMWVGYAELASAVSRLGIVGLL